MSKIKLFITGALIVALTVYLTATNIMSSQIKARYTAIEALANVHAGVQTLETDFKEGLTSLRADTDVVLGSSKDPDKSISFKILSHFSYIPGYDDGLYFLTVKSSFIPTGNSKKALSESLLAIPSLTFGAKRFINGKQEAKLSIGPIATLENPEPILEKGLSISSVSKPKKWAYTVLRIPSLAIQSSEQKILGRNIFAAYQISMRNGLNHVKSKVGTESIAIEDLSSNVNISGSQVSITMRNINQSAFKTFEDMTPRGYQSFLENFDQSLLELVTGIFEQSESIQLSLATKIEKASQKTIHQGEKSFSGFSDRWLANRSTKGFDLHYSMDMDTWINETADSRIGKSYARLNIKDIAIENPSFLNQALVSPSLWSLNAFGAGLNAKFKVGIDNEKALASGVLSNNDGKKVIPAFQAAPPYKAKLFVKVTETLGSLIPERYMDYFQYDKGLYSLAFEIDNGAAKLNRKPLGVQSFASKRLLSH